MRCMGRKLAVLGLLLWAGAVAAAPATGRLAAPGPMFSLDYELPANSPAVRETLTTRPSPQRLQVDCAVARAGRCSVRAEVSAAPDSVSAGAYRAESDTMNVQATRYSPGDTLRYRFSVLLAADWAIAPTSAIDILWQFKRFASPPDMFVAAKGDALVLRVGKKAQVLLLKPLPLGRWVDVTMQVHWSAGEDGWAKGVLATADGAVSNQFNYAGPTTWNDRPKAAYLKWGLYKPGKTDGSFRFATRRVWHDEVVVESLGR